MEELECPSPFGVVKLRVLEGRLIRVWLGHRAARNATGTAGAALTAAPFAELLRAYFQGSGITVDAGALDLSGVSPFGREVLLELTKVRFGHVVTYGELAARVGAPRAARAVGQAVARNPLPIFVPCHRVLAADQRLGGFSAGLKWKSNLLSHEGWFVKEGKIVKRETAKGKPRTCVYAGSFDPPTMGHMHMIEKGAAMFDRLIVSVGINPNKRCTFSLDDRLEMLRLCTDGLGNVEVDSFEGQFLVHYAESKGAGYVLRGIRSEEDYRFEHAMRNVNEDLEPGVTTVFLIPPREICEVSSSFVKGLVGFAGWEEVVKPYVPEPVYQKLLVTKIQWNQQSAGAESGSD